MSYYIYTQKEVLKNHINNLMSDYEVLIYLHSNFEQIKSNYENLEQIKNSINSEYNTEEELVSLATKLLQFKKDISSIYDLKDKDVCTQMTVHFRYDKEKKVNGWGGYTDSVTFDNLEIAMKYVNKEEAVYDYLDNYYEIRIDETPLYVTTDSGTIIWENENYINDFVLNAVKSNLSNEDMLLNLYTMKFMNSAKDFSIVVYGEEYNASQLERFPNFDGGASYQIDKTEFKSDDLEMLIYKDNEIWRGYNTSKTR